MTRKTQAQLKDQESPEDDEDLSQYKGSASSDDIRSSTDILRDVMIFHDTKAKDIILEILVLLKTENRRGDLIAMMYKKYCDTITIVVDCAAKLAPYEKPKLQSIELKSEHVHKFVLRAPSQALTTDAWIKDVTPDIPREPPKIIDIPKLGNVIDYDNTHINVYEDLEDIEYNTEVNSGEF